ncbi:MAG: helix-turn-helix transcriptional regulator [Clostridia bacterium]|nr:helix-turn-helix transcriptional regulator [Clostridia bacterium]
MNYMKKARLEKGLSQAKVAQAVGVSNSTPGLWELGKTKPTIPVKEALSKLLDVPIDKLFEEVPEEDTPKKESTQTAQKAAETAPKSERANQRKEEHTAPEKPENKAADPLDAYIKASEQTASNPLKNALPAPLRIPGSVEISRTTYRNKVKGAIYKLTRIFGDNRSMLIAMEFLADELEIRIFNKEN